MKDGNKYFINKKFDGYMTIEASLIVPKIFLIFCGIIYLTFFLYNHCIAYQSCYLACLRAQQIRYGSTKDIETYTYNQLGKLLEGQVYQYQKELSVDVSVMSVKASAMSEIINKLEKLGVFNMGKFAYKQEVSVMNFNPSSVIRKVAR